MWMVALVALTALRAEAQEAARCLDWKPAEVLVSSPAGRVFEAQGNRIFGIGGVGG